MGTITTSNTLFKPELVAEMFDKVKGHSSLAKLSGMKPIPFSGNDIFVFTMDGEASIVGEGGAKPAGNADFQPVSIKPVKFVYQHRITDEFVKMSEEKQLPYLEAFTTGFAKKIARALDIAAFHGVNPATGTASDIVGSNNFDAKVTKSVVYAAATPDDNLDSAVGEVQKDDGVITGIVMTPAMGAALGAMKAKNSNTAIYPEFRFGQNPDSFAGMGCDINSTLAFGGSTDKAFVGDFANAFKWGYADDIPLEIIQFGDPDGQGDLKKLNQIVLRAEAYIGWGILDANSFCKVADGE